MLKDVSVSSRLSTTPIAGDRNREHDDERVAQRLVLRRHHRVDEQHGEHQHQLQLLERLRLLLDLGAEADREVRRHANLAEPRLHGRDRLAQRDLDLGVDARDALHVLAVDLHRAGVAGRRPCTFLAGTTWPLGVLSEHVADVGDLLAVGLRAAARRSGTRCRARGTAPRWCRPRWSGSWWRRPDTVMPSMAAFGRSTRTEISGRPSSRPMRTSAMPGVASISCCASSATRRASSRSWPRISSARRRVLVVAAAAEQALQLEVAAGRVGADDDARAGRRAGGAGRARSPRWCASAGRAAPAGCGSGRGWSGRRHRRRRRRCCCRRRRRW